MFADADDKTLSDSIGLILKEQQKRHPAVFLRLEKTDCGGRDKIYKALMSTAEDNMPGAAFSDVFLAAIYLVQAIIIDQEHRQGITSFDGILAGRSMAVYAFYKAIFDPDVMSRLDQIRKVLDENKDEEEAA